MKKIISIIMLFAAAAMAFNSCQKQEVVAPEKANEVTLTFSSEKPSFVDESKTEWNGSSIVWSAGDKISVAYTVAGKWMGYMPKDSDKESAPKLYKSDALDKSYPTAKFNVSGEFNITSEGTHKFYGVYPAPSSTAFADAPVADLTIPSLQTPKPSSFDPSADLMTGVSVGEFNSLPKPGDEISMMWTRLVAHANITLKSVNGIAADEKIFSITLTAQDDANLVGKQKVNLLTNEVNQAVASAKTNEVKLNGGNLSIDANRNIEFWACILPATLTSLKVEVDTDKATYTREIKNISKTFIQNARNTLSIKMDGATRVEKAVETWKLVTPAEGITAGTYAFVAKTSTKTGVLVNSNGTSAAPTFYTANISIDGDCLLGVSESMQFDITGTAGNYVIYVAGTTAKWLYCINENNGVRVGTSEDKTWSITAHSSNSSAFQLKHIGKSRYLGVYSNQDWRCYTSLTASNFTSNTGSSQIYLYKKTTGSVAPDTTPKLEVGKTSIELSSEADEGTVSVEAANVYSLQVRALVAEGSQDEVTWLSVEYDENGTLSYTAEANDSENSREAYIEIYAEDLEGNPLTEYIHVTQDGKSEGGAVEPVDVTISFATTAQRTSQTTTQQVWTNGGVVLTNNKSESQNDVVASYNPARFYAASQIIITAPGNISQIVFDCNTTEYATNLKNSISGASVAVSSKKVTITLNGSSDTFTIAKLSAQVRADAVTVTYLGEATGGETPEPEQPTLTPRNLAFSVATATATVGQAFTAPTLSGVTTGVTYSSSNTGVATVNNSGVVTIVAAGTTTITASAPATDEYEAGTASYTLTVNAAQGGGQQTTTTYTFNSKSWGDSTNSWTSGKAGNQLTSGQGVQVTTGVSGANATCKNSFSNVSTVVVKYCTNASKGAGTIKVTIGSVTKTFTVSTSGGTSLRNATFDFNGATGTPKIEVTCTTNSIYVNAISITHTN